jgi:hypothetical protein
MMENNYLKDIPVSEHVRDDIKKKQPSKKGYVRLERT